MSIEAKNFRSTQFQFRKARLMKDLGFDGWDLSLAFWTGECAYRAALLIGGAA